MLYLLVCMVIGLLQKMLQTQVELLVETKTVRRK